MGWSWKKKACKFLKIIDFDHINLKKYPLTENYSKLHEKSIPNFHRSKHKPKVCLQNQLEKKKKKKKIKEWKRKLNPKRWKKSLPAGAEKVIPLGFSSAMAAFTDSEKLFCFLLFCRFDEKWKQKKETGHSIGSTTHGLLPEIVRPNNTWPDSSGPTTDARSMIKDDNRDELEWGLQL